VGRHRHLFQQRRVVVWRFGGSLERISNGTDTHADGLLLGCALAFRLSADGPRLGRFGVRVIQVAATAGTMALVGAVVVGTYRLPLILVTYPLAVLVASLVIWTVVVEPVPILHSVLTSRAAEWVGRRSYGLYLWHFPLYVGLPLSSLSSWERDALHIALTVGAAALSFRYIEQPFLRRKAQVKRTMAHGADVPSR
jgi:peptidoglycan/LPS O-acetylase OafA/YrhL